MPVIFDDAVRFESHVPVLVVGGGAARGVSGANVWGYLSGNGLLAAVTMGRLAGASAAAAAPGTQSG